MLTALSRRVRAMPALAAMAVLAAAPAAAQTGSRTVVFTANGNADSVSAVDASHWSVRQTLHLQLMPHNVQTSDDGRYLFVTANGPPSMPDMPGMSAEMMEPGYLLLFDEQHPHAPALFTLPLGMHAAHVIVDRANRFAYVTVSGNGVVDVVDVRAGRVAAQIPVGVMPHGLRMSPDGSRIYVADMTSAAVSVIDVLQRKEIARIPVGKTPTQVAVSPDGSAVYVTLAGENAVGVIDTARGKLAGKIPVGANPAQLFMSPDGKRVYVANQGTKDAPGHTVSIIDTAAQRVSASVRVPAGPHGVVVSSDGAHVFVTDAFDAKLTEIDAKTLSVRSIGVGAGPNGVTLGV